MEKVNINKTPKLIMYTVKDLMVWKMGLLILVEEIYLLFLRILKKLLLKMMISPYSNSKLLIN